MIRRIVISLLLLLLGFRVDGQTPITTRAFDNARTGANPHETTLTQALVRKGMRKYFTLYTEGDARGTESQPLILPNVTMPDGTVRDVVIVSTMNNLVWAYDANTSDILWVQKLGVPIKGGPSIDSHLINDHWGVLSTGVIDPDTKRLYEVAWTSPDATPQKGSHAVYVLDIPTGQLVTPAVPLAGLTYQPTGGALQRYSSTMRKQRSSLLLTNVNGVKTVFFACGTVLETTSGAAGWLVAFDVATNTVSAGLTFTAGDGAGMWMAGQGMAADAQGYLYGVTGNGSFNGVDNFGESAVKVKYTPRSPAGSAKLSVVDWWSPYTDQGRVGGDVTGRLQMARVAKKLAGVSLPTEQIKQDAEEGMPINGMARPSYVGAKVVDNGVARLVYPRAANNGAYSDEDLGSAGGALIEQYQTYLASGKDGIGYAVNATAMGKTQPVDFLNAKANCAKLKSPPVWLTESPGPVDACPQDPTTLNFQPWGKTRHMHATPVQYMSPVHGLEIFVWGENSQLHAWSMSPSGALTYLAQSNEFASINNTNPPGGMPGGFCSLSSNSNAAGSAVLWCTIPYGDGNATVTNGRLLAYDPDNFITNADGSKTLAVLWDSQAAAIPFLFNKFDPPIVYRGKLFVPNYSGGVDVYGPA